MSNEYVKTKPVFDSTGRLIGQELQGPVSQFFGKITIQNITENTLTAVLCSTRHHGGATSMPSDHHFNGR